MRGQKGSSDSSGMPSAASNDAEQLRRIVHELADALTATSSYLRAGQSVANQEKLREVIGKALEQTDRAGEAVVPKRSLWWATTKAALRNCLTLRDNRCAALRPWLRPACTMR